MRAVVGFHSNEELATALEDFPGAKIVRRIPSYEDGRGRAGRAREPASRPSGNRLRAPPAGASENGRARPHGDVPPGPPLRVAVRRHARERSARGRPAGGERDQDRRRRHRCGRDASRPGREVARDLGRRSPSHERQGQRRPRHVRLLPRHGLRRQRRGNRRLRRRRQAPHGQCGRRGRQLQRRRRGRRDHLRGRPRREDRQSVDRRRRHLCARAEGGALRRQPQRAPGRRRGQRVRGRQSDRVPRRRAPAAWLERTGRVRPLGRSQHDVGEARVLLEHRLADLPRSPRRKRLRRHRLDFREGVVAALRPPRLPGRPLRLVERYVVREPRSRRCGGTRLGREPVADRAAGGRDPQGDRLGQRQMESAARLRRDRRRRRRRQGSGSFHRAARAGRRVDQPPPGEQPARPLGPLRFPSPPRPSRTAPRGAPANERPARAAGIPDDHPPGTARRQLAPARPRNDAHRGRDPLDGRPPAGPLRAPRGLPRPLGSPQRDPAQAGKGSLGRDALDAGAECPEALVDPLVALVDLVDRPDRRLALGAEARDQHRHPGADVRALHPLAVQPRRPGDDRTVRVAEDDPRAHRDELVREEQPVLEHLLEDQHRPARLRRDGERDRGAGRPGTRATDRPRSSGCARRCRPRCTSSWPGGTRTVRPPTSTRTPSRANVGRIEIRSSGRRRPRSSRRRPSPRRAR